MSPSESPQLSLPLEEFYTRLLVPTIARHKRVFCNRNLRMHQIAWIGFDMDYTLAIYNQAEMDELSIRATMAKLVARGYPTFLTSIPYSITFPVRGLLIDKRYGHVLKMDRYKHVTKGYHGFRELPKDELRELYHAKKVRASTPRYHWIDTLYALSEAALYSAIVEAFEQRGLATDFGRIFHDIRECIDEAHRDGTILDAVSSDLPRYIMRDPDLAPTLHKLRSAGKKLFVLTNSHRWYTEKMMHYLLDGQMGEYPSWRNFFDVTIVAASKPAFFQERRPLMANDNDALKPAKLPLERGHIYQGGNLADLERGLGVHGDQILYVGDHIYGDILRSKKDSAWRTAMIIQELETEVLAHETCREDYVRTEQIEEMRERLEDELRFYQGRFKELTRRIEQQKEAPDLDAERVRIKRALERVRARLKQVEVEMSMIERRIDLRFHPYWGSLLKEGNEQSLFGAQVDEYACLYTSRVSNLLSYSPQQFYRSPRDEMAHEIG